MALHQLEYLDGQGRQHPSPRMNKDQSADAAKKIFFHSSADKVPVQMCDFGSLQKKKILFFVTFKATPQSAFCSAPEISR